MGIDASNLFTGVEWVPLSSTSGSGRAERVDGGHPFIPAVPVAASHFQGCCFGAHLVIWAVTHPLCSPCSSWLLPDASSSRQGDLALLSGLRRLRVVGRRGMELPYHPNMQR